MDLVGGEGLVDGVWRMGLMAGTQGSLHVPEVW